MARVHFVKKARKDNPVAKRGESYYWWQHRYGPKQFSKNQPKRSQTTGSEFLSNVYSIEEDIAEAKPSDREELQGLIEGWCERIQELADECQEKFDNMPDGLQQGDTGQLLEGRSQACEDWIGELEGIDLEQDLEDSDEDTRTEEALEEVQSASYQGE